MTASHAKTQLIKSTHALIRGDHDAGIRYMLEVMGFIDQQVELEELEPLTLDELKDVVRQ